MVSFHVLRGLRLALLPLFGVVISVFLVGIMSGCKAPAPVDKGVIVTLRHATTSGSTELQAALIVANHTQTALVLPAIKLHMAAVLEQVSGAGYTTSASGSEHVFTPALANNQPPVLQPDDSLIIQLEGEMLATFALPTTVTLGNAEAPVTLEAVPFDAKRANARKTADGKTNAIKLLPYPEEYVPMGEIRLGQGRLFPIWGQSFDAVLPVNRKSWAIALAHSAHLFRVVSGIESVTPNYYLATTVKETLLAADPAAEAPNRARYPFAFVYQPKAQAQGFFQIEKATAYTELSKVYPNRLPAEGHTAIVGADHFEMAALAKAHYDMFAVKYWEYGMGWEPQKFIAEASDSMALPKLMGLTFHQGIWSGEVKQMLTTDRAAALQCHDLAERVSGSDVAYNMRTLGNATTLLDGKVSRLAPELRRINTRTRLPNNQFYGYYDERITWADLDTYISRIAPMYRSVNLARVRARVRIAFDRVHGGEPISFQNELGTVLDQLILSLPSDDPTAYVVRNYGNHKHRGAMAEKSKQGSANTTFSTH